MLTRAVWTCGGQLLALRNHSQAFRGWQCPKLLSSHAMSKEVIFELLIPTSESCICVLQLLALPDYLTVTEVASPQWVFRCCSQGVGRAGARDSRGEAHRHLCSLQRAVAFLAPRAPLQSQPHCPSLCLLHRCPGCYKPSRQARTTASIEGDTGTGGGELERTRDYLVSETLHNKS